jgi:putative methyltransferase (TIGR04325 family)
MAPLRRLKKLLKILRPIDRYVYGRRFENNRNEHLFRGVYRSMAEAAASAPDSRPLGYDNAASASMYRELIDSVAIADYPVLYWLRTLAGEVQSVFDFGGHIGVKYYSYTRFLGASFDWTVCDVPAVAAAGKAIAEERSAGQQLHFVSEFEESDGVDLLLCSGSLQYIEEPLAVSLSRVARLPRHLLVNITAFGESPTFFTLNSIGTAFCPYKIQNLGEFTSALQLLGYVVIHQWIVPGKNNFIHLRPDKSYWDYRGLYLRLQ